MDYTKKNGVLVPKQRLFAPMLSTFGGGSIRGFKGAGGGGEFIYTGGTAATDHDSTLRVSYWDTSTIHSHLSGGTYTGTDERVAQTINTGQSFNLGNRAIFPVVFRMGANSFNSGGSAFAKSYAKICMLYIGTDGSSRLGPAYDLSANDVVGSTFMDDDCFTTGQSNTKFNDTDSKYFILWPNEYRYDQETSNSFGIAFNADLADASQYYYYQANFSVDIDTLQITKTNETRRSSNSNTDTFSNLDSPFTNQSASYTNVNLLQGLVVGQGAQMVPIPNSNDVAFHFGGLSNFYGNSTWAPRYCVFTTSKTSDPTMQLAYYQTGTHDHLVAGASVRTSNNTTAGYSISWGNNSPLRRTVTLYNNNGTTNSSTPTTVTNFTNSDLAFEGWHDPETLRAYIVHPDGAGNGTVIQGNVDNSITDLYGQNVVVKNSGSDPDFLIASVDGRNLLYYENGVLYNHNNYSTTGLAASGLGWSHSGSEQITGTYSYRAYRYQRGIIPTTVEGYDYKGGFVIGNRQNATSLQNYDKTCNILAYAGRP